MAQVAGAYPESKENDKAEGQPGVRYGGPLKAILRVRFFFFFMKNHCILLSLEEHA